MSESVELIDRFQFFNFGIAMPLFIPEFWLGAVLLYFLYFSFFMLPHFAAYWQFHFLPWNKRVWALKPFIQTIGIYTVAMVWIFFTLM